MFNKIAVIICLVIFIQSCTTKNDPPAPAGFSSTSSTSSTSNSSATTATSSSSATSSTSSTTSTTATSATSSTSTTTTTSSTSSTSSSINFNSTTVVMDSIVAEQISTSPPIYEITALNISAQYAMSIKLYGNKPTTNTTYNVIDPGTTNIGPGECEIAVIDNKADVYESLSGTTLTTTVSGSMVTATFSNINMSDGTVTVVLSGTITWK